MKTATEIVGLIALVLGLIFVGYEIQQNTNALSAQALLELNNAINDDMRLIAESPVLADVYHRGTQSLESLDSSELVQFENLELSTFNTYEAAYLFHKKGLIDDSDYAVWINAACAELSLPGVQQMLASKTMLLNNEFQTMLSSSCSSDKGNQ